MAGVIKSKTLRAEDVKHKCNVPSAWLGVLLPDEGQGSQVRIKVRDYGMRRRYEFMLKTRRELYKKPVFQSDGWRKFVRDNKLQEGDELYFWKEGGEEGHIIGVQARVGPILIKVFGQNFQP